ncbi:MAG: hypothetical protein ACR2MN_14285 [Acidimicrobiales bacterium]
MDRDQPGPRHLVPGSARASDWQLHHFRADALLAPRGLAVGHIFDRSGNHRATVSQEVLLRRAG